VELLVGTVDHPECKQTRQELGGVGYTIRKVGNKLIILGAHDNLTLEAAEFFAKTVRESKPRTWEADYTQRYEAVLVESKYSDEPIVAEVVATEAPYYADPTGKTDSTYAIQRAIDDCDKRGGGTVYLPAGEYLVTSTVYVSDGVILRGDWQDPDTTDNPEYGTVMAHLLHDLQEAGILTSIDVVSDSSGLFAEKVIPALRYTDNAFMNEIEACGISGLAPRDGNGRIILENIKTTMEQIMAEGVGARVIVHCPEAGFCLNKNGEFTVVPSLKLPKGYIKGTVGAGDAFCAGCLYAIYRDYDDKAMLELAAGAAACSLSAPDAVSGMRDKDYISELIKTTERVTL
jgi:hypothetical protein